MFEVIADTFVSMEVILLKNLALISLIVFSNVDPGLNFDALVLLFIPSGSFFLSNSLC